MEIIEQGKWEHEGFEITWEEKTDKVEGLYTLLFTAVKDD